MSRDKNVQKFSFELVLNCSKSEATLMIYFILQTGTDQENVDLSVDMQQDIVSIQCTETNPFRLVSTQIWQMPLP